MILPYKDKSPIIPPTAFVADGVTITGDVELGEYTNIWFGTVIRGDVNYIRIGSGTNIQDNSTVHVTRKTAPTHIGSDVTVGHMALIHGCTIENQCLIGMGSIVMDGAVVGTGSIVGAGALVTPGTKIPERSLYVGQPARLVRSVSDAEFQHILDSARRYIQDAQNYQNQR